MRNLDFSSIHALITTLLSLAVITLIGVGIRLLTMVTIQQRRERMNRQINERLRALIAAYKTLGGSFTGDLSVDPTHRRDLRWHTEAPAAASSEPSDLGVADPPGSDRARRVRDAVEAALLPLATEIGPVRHFILAHPKLMVSGANLHVPGK